MAIKLLSSTKIGNFTLPHTDGTGGQALVTDGNGNISFAHTGGVTGLSFTSGVLTATRAAGNITVNLDGRYALTSHNHSGVYDNYQSWNLKTNGVQRTTVQSGGTLDLVAGSNVTLSYGAGGVVTIAAASSTETDTLATVTGRGASTNTPVTFNGNVTLGNSADLVFQDLAGTFPTSGKGFDWTLNNDGARIYAVQPSSDSIDLVFQLRDNATTNDRFVFWVDDYQGAAFDKYPLIIRGGTEFDLVDSGLFVRGTQVITNGRNLQNVTGNISMFTNDSGYITGSGSTSGNAGSATVLQTARTINGTSFNGSANITTASWGTARTITIGSTGKSVDGSGNISWTLAEIGAQAAGSYAAASHTHVWTDITNRPTTVSSFTNDSGYITSTGSISGNAATATALQTARTLTIGSTGKTFNGSANVSWTLAEIGAQAAGSYAASVHTHDDRYYTEAESDGRFIRKNTWEGSAYVGTGGDFYGTIFYDSNNTGYYMDPASTSNLNGVSARQYYQTLHGEPRNNLGDPTVTDMALFDAQFNNKTEFYPASKVKFFTSSDGTNFSEYTGFSDVQKQKFMGGDEDSGVFIPNLTNRFRIELDASGYVFVSMLYMYWSSNSHSTKMHIWARRCDNQQWYQITSSDTYISSWPGHATLPFPSIAWLEGNTTSSGHHDKIRIEFIPSWSGHPTYGGNVISLNRLQMWGGYPAGKRNIFTTYYDRSIAYPGTVSAPTFSGALSGNASTATSAATWTTGRTITIGNTGKTVNGSGDVSWSLTEIGAQPAGNYATQAYVNTAVANVVNSAPAALDTLNELATALGNDASFSTTVSTALGNRLRVDTAAQGLTGTQQSNARTNLGLGTAATSNTGDFATSGHSHSNATTGAAGFMSAADKSKLDGIASGATANTGTVTSVSGTGTVSGLTLSGTVTTSGSLTLGGTLTLTSAQVTTALGFTPYNSTNPNGYITSSGSISGNAATATYATSAGTADQIDSVGFRNTGSNAPINADTLDSNGITYYTGGVTNFSGNASDGALYSQVYSSSWQHQIAGDYRSGMIAVRGKNNGTWTSWRTIIDSSTIGSQSVNYATTAGSAPANGGNSNTVAGLSVHSARNNEANKIVRTDGNGYIQAGWINTPSGAFGSAITKIYCSDDDYVRYQTPANFISNLGLITTSNIGSQSVNYASSAGSVAWGNVSGRPTAVSSFTNDSGYITSGGSISGSSRLLAHVDGPRDLSDRRPNWNARTATFDFVGAGTGNGSGNYAGVLTFVPWDGTSASTGDSSYQLSFANQSGVNASGPARLSIRNGINSTWNSWQEILTSSNYNSYSPTLTGGNASGTWGISISGNAASASSVAWGNVSSRPTALSQFTNDSGFITSSGNASKLNPLSGDSNYKLAYTADGARTNAGEWGRAVMYYVPNGQTYGIRVDRADYADSAGSANSVAWGNVSGRPTNVSSFSNDSGYLANGSSPTFTDVYVNGWFRNYGRQGMYNQDYGNHFYANSDAYWTVAGNNGSAGGIMFRTGGHEGTLRGYVYVDSSSNIGFLNSGGSWSLRCDNSGNVTATGDLTAYSDARIKTEVKTVEDALDKVLALRGVTYKRTDTEDKSTKIGVIAQEVKEVLPEVVSENEDGMLTVSYGNMVGVLIEAMKEQQAMIETLEAKIELLTRYLK